MLNKSLELLDEAEKAIYEDFDKAKELVDIADDLIDDAEAL